MFGKIFNLFKKKLKLITHDGTFHADEIFATAALKILFNKRGESFEVVRTRVEEVFKTGDYVYDVGGVYDEVNNRFDHHQPGGAGAYADGIPYSSFGLIWKKHGSEIAGGEEVMEIITEKLVKPIDAFDNGVSITESKSKVDPYIIQRFFESISRPTWEEDVALTDAYFNRNVELAKEILEREIVHTQAKINARAGLIKCYEDAKDKRIVVFDRRYPLGGINKLMPEALFIVSERRHDGVWSLLTIRKTDDPDNFANKKDLPKAWAGLRDEELQKVTGVSDAVFCHNALWMAVAKTKEGVMKLAQIALES